MTHEPVTAENLTRSECVWGSAAGGIVTLFQHQPCVDCGMLCGPCPGCSRVGTMELSRRHRLAL